MWSVLKQAVGKDLTRLTMPVIFNEPLSFIQRLAEYFEYVDLLHQATRTEVGGLFFDSSCGRDLLYSGFSSQTF